LVLVSERILLELTERSPESASACRSIVVHAVDKGVVHDARHLGWVGGEHAARVNAEVLERAPEAGSRHLQRNSGVRDKADILIERLALCNHRLAHSEGELAAATHDALTERTEDIGELAKDRVDEAAAAHNHVKVLGRGQTVGLLLAITDVVDGGSQRLAKGHLGSGVAVGDVIGGILVNTGVGSCVVLRGQVIGLHAARRHTRAVSTRAAHPGAALRAGLAVT